MSGKKILLYTDESTAGGVAHYNNVLLEKLLERGWRVHGAQPRNDTPLLEIQRQRGVVHEWISYEPRNEFQRSMTDTVDPAKILGEVRPDVIFFSDCSPISNIAAKHIAIQHKIPFVILCHSGAAYLAEKFPACLGVVKKQYQYARQVIAISRRSLEVLHQYFGLPVDKGVAILNGRPDKFFAPVDDAVRARIRSELTIPRDGILFFTSARFDLAKGYQFLFAAIKQLHDRGCLGSCYFSWAGIGEIHSEIGKAIADAGLASRIRLLGQRWDIAELLDASDCFVLPTMNEGGLPLSAMEAMAKGLPTIVSSVCGIPEIVGGACHLLPDPNVRPQDTVSELANGIYTLSRDATKRQALGTAGRKLAQKSFRQEANLPQTLAVIDAAVAADIISHGVGSAALSPASPVYSADVVQIESSVVRGKQVPFVSAIVSTYKSQRFITGCMEDLIEQTLFKRGQLEIVVVDSCSPENEGVVVKEFQQRYPNIVYIRTDKRETLYAAWNRGIKAASGRYVTNANTDDRHAKDALETMAAALVARPEIALIYGDCYLSTTPNESFAENRRDRIYKYPEFFAPAALLHYQFGPQPMWRKSVHDTVGYFDGTMRAAGDYDFNLRLAQKSKAFHLAMPLGSYLAHEGAISFTDDTMVRETQQIHALYHQDMVVETLYAQAGVAIATQVEKALVHLDLGLRALEYFPPWKQGQPEVNPNLAIRCFSRALEMNPDASSALNNLFCLLNWVKKPTEALSLLRERPKLAGHPVIKANLERVRQSDFLKKGGQGLSLMPSSLQLPSQRALASEKQKEGMSAR